MRGEVAVTTCSSLARPVPLLSSLSVRTCVELQYKTIHQTTVNTTSDTVIQHYLLLRKQHSTLQRISPKYAVIKRTNRFQLKMKNIYASNQIPSDSSKLEIFAFLQTQFVFEWDKTRPSACCMMWRDVHVAWLQARCRRGGGVGRDLSCIWLNPDERGRARVG